MQAELKKRFWKWQTQSYLSLSKRRRTLFTESSTVTQISVLDKSSPKDQPASETHTLTTSNVSAVWGWFNSAGLHVLCGATKPQNLIVPLNTVWRISRGAAKISVDNLSVLFFIDSISHIFHIVKHFSSYRLQYWQAERSQLLSPFVLIIVFVLKALLHILLTTMSSFLLLLVKQMLSQQVCSECGCKTLSFLFSKFM